MCKQIRPAVTEDISRIAEILIFTKRSAYRAIFQNDHVSFGEMQVLPLAETYLENPEKLNDYYVYEDDFVKGLIHIEQTEICELYVDPFFEGQGIGGKLMKFALSQGAGHLWVLEKNESAIRFYKGNGFFFTSEKKLQEGTDEYIVGMLHA